MTYADKLMLLALLHGALLVGCLCTMASLPRSAR